MIEFIRQKKILILVVLITLAGIIGIGYQSAEQKSEPIYRSKIDRIMYDTHNQSPKYVITLPDRNKKSKKPEEVVSVGEEAAQAETTAKPQKEEDITSGVCPVFHVKRRTHRFCIGRIAHMIQPNQ